MTEQADNPRGRRRCWWAILFVLLAFAAAAPGQMKFDQQGGRLSVDTTDLIVVRNATWSVKVGGDEVLGSSALGREDLDVAWKVSGLSDRAGGVIELTVRNKSAHDLNISQIQPLRALRADDAACEFGVKRRQSGVTKCLTNGYIYYDSGRLIDFGPGQSRKIESFWDAAFYQPDPRRVLFVGYLNNDIAEGRISAARLDGEAGFDLAATSLLHPAFVLKPGQSISSGKLMLLVSDDPWDALERYADSIVPKKKLNPVINGWCSWFVYYGGVSEAEVLKNAEFIAKELKPYGMEWVQIDDGFYRAFGAWEGNERFGRGMKHTADEIRKLGLRPGLWIAPYAVSEAAPIARAHPEWLAHRGDGTLQKIEQAHAGQAQYILDITHPGARQWLGDLLKTITHDWGYDFIKTDFVEWTLLAQEQFHDPTITKAQAYRLGDSIMRDAMGPDRHFLDCGPGNEAVGLIDSMRIGLDRPDDLPNFRLWQQSRK